MSTETDEAAAALLPYTVLAGDVFKALLSQGIPEQLACDLTFHWLTAEMVDPVDE